jgi:hypothetical protein
MNLEIGRIVDEMGGGKHESGFRFTGRAWIRRGSWATSGGSQQHSVLANLAIDAIRPGVDPAAQVADLLESLLPQKLNGLYAARAHFAKGNDLLPNVQLLETLRKLSQGDQMAPNV